MILCHISSPIRGLDEIFGRILRNLDISYRQIEVVSVNLEGINKRQKASPVSKGQHNSFIYPRAVGIKETVQVFKHLVRGHGGDLKSWASLIVKLKVLLKLKECRVIFGEEITPGWEISNSTGLIGVSVIFIGKKCSGILSDQNDQ